MSLVTHEQQGTTVSVQFQYGNPGDNGGLLCDKWLAGPKHPANSRTDLQWDTDLESKGKKNLFGTNKTIL